MTLPDYYSILGLESTATQDEIRHVYQRLSIACHPDNTAAGDFIDPHRRFQELADAYYILSDTQRRRNYDQARMKHATAITSLFATKASKAEHADADHVFVDAFEELMRPEMEKQGLGVWWVAGGVSGAVLGFIVGICPISII